ncbi:unnamed protein product [Moneuplotes crassus]|uniref:F-actin-capping protein subunit alpha n=2 Tax=Euplotes crassus TaxID=5936 RepID=A0AAD2D198_EUPCR|nr:unnamed protein product [Moneuplotes crassus]|eukprot:CAMPEP_0197003984 /NCGR_PEP_ID=MMETSP1380-20130617/16998_1 /TAXON_ID=5936 /ORGANISM="Euplotes crassus, Strain CT5" /LENGTH=299 /DNA_ID=CAMNT_0042422615 /DNA_START=8 /DNA_END=907 /DNA_ORIENTATION=+
MSDSKTKALQYFIQEATVGELEYIIDDIGTIVGNKDFLQQPEIIQALREYQERHLNHQTLPDGTKVVVTEKGRRETEVTKEPEPEAEGEGEQPPAETDPFEFTYVDEARNIKFTLNVNSGEVKVVNDAEKHHDEAVQGFKEQLVESLDKYIAGHYKELTTLGTVSVEGTDQITAHIEISCHNLNHKNFWGGEWLSRWTVTHTLGSSDFEITGRINIHNHYFEQGNIQFELNKSFDSPTAGTVSGDAAESIIAAINKLEENYQVSLEEMYEEISDNHMKNLRRKLPFTGKNFEWGVSKLM